MVLEQEQNKRQTNINVSSSKTKQKSVRVAKKTNIKKTNKVAKPEV